MNCWQPPSQSVQKSNQIWILITGYSYTVRNSYHKEERTVMTDGQVNHCSVGISRFGLAHAHKHTFTHSDFLCRDGAQHTKIIPVDVIQLEIFPYCNPNFPFSGVITNNPPLPTPLHLWECLMLRKQARKTFRNDYSVFLGSITFILRHTQYKLDMQLDFPVCKAKNILLSHHVNVKIHKHSLK